MRLRQPAIGITCDTWVPEGRPEAYELLCDHRYPESVKRSGGYPVLLPIARRPHVIEYYLDGVDGLIIVGGDDVDPRLYGEAVKPGTGSVFRPRLSFECELYEGARRRGLPVFGICYGLQLINVLEGGTLFQDIRRDAKSPINHQDKEDPLRQVRVEPRSRLGKILGTRRLSVHCDHHQAVSRVAPGFRPVAFAPDGIIEAVESDREHVYAVQWHPERRLRAKASDRLFRAFVASCAQRARKRT